MVVSPSARSQTVSYLKDEILCRKQTNLNLQEIPQIQRMIGMIDDAIRSNAYYEVAPEDLDNRPTPVPTMHLSLRDRSLFLRSALNTLRLAGGEESIDLLRTEIVSRYSSASGLSAATLANLLAEYKTLLSPREGSDGTIWRIEPAGEEFLDKPFDINSLADEPSESISQDLAQSQVSQKRPYDPQRISVRIKQLSLFQVRRRLEKGGIVLQPDFQRHVVWDDERQSRLIESLLIRIPIPAFFLDATSDEHWQVIDGLQRLTTIQRFCQHGKLRLTGLEFMPELTGKTFAELPPSLQQRIDDDTELTLYLLQPGTPPEAKFTIFSRVNTGGLVLNSQEIRHAVYQGPATKFLSELGKDTYFLDATGNGVSAIRMDDRECALRFVAFRLRPYADYREPLDKFLNEAMQELNRLGNAEPARLEILRREFQDAMKKAKLVFEDLAFRKVSENLIRRGPVNKALFESWAISLLPYDDALLRTHRKDIVERFLTTMSGDMNYYKSISSYTGNRTAVVRRFQAAETIIADACRVGEAP